MYSQEITWLLREKYHGEKSAAFFADVEKLEHGIPLAYLIGSIPFLNTTIQLDSHPLIPRPETEFWVEKAIKVIQNQTSPVRILDLCAGSGAIGVAVASAIKTSAVDFIEIESAHLPTIAKNCRLNSIEADRVHIYQGDLFVVNTDSQLGQYDYILTNPPYIDSSLNRTEKSVLDNEPSLALFGGNAGLEIINSIIIDAVHYLNPAGQLWIEHEPEQSSAIQLLGQQHGFAQHTHLDQFNIERFSVLVLQ